MKKLILFIINILLISSVFCNDLIFTTKVITGGKCKIADNSPKFEFYNSDINKKSRFDLELEYKSSIWGIDGKIRHQPTSVPKDFPYFNVSFSYFYLNLFDETLQFKTGIVDDYNYITNGDKGIDILWHQAGFLVNYKPIKGLSLGLFGCIPFEDDDIWDLYTMISYKNQYFSFQSGYKIFDEYFYFGIDCCGFKWLKSYFELEIFNLYSDVNPKSEVELYFYILPVLYVDLTSYQTYKTNYYDFDGTLNYKIVVLDNLNFVLSGGYFHNFKKDTNSYSAGIKVNYVVIKDLSTSLSYSLSYSDKLNQVIQFNLNYKFVKKISF